MDCKLIAFPLVRRIGKIRRVAEVYRGKTGNDADGYWRKQISQLAENLASFDVPKAEIDRQLRAFRDAVNVELARAKRETGAA